MTDGPIYGALVRHDIADWNQWKAAFDAHEGARKDAGIVLHTVHKQDGNENHIAVYLASPSLDGLKAFASSDELKAAMKDAGVTSAPDITFVQNREMKLSENPGDNAGMIVVHSVADYDEWKKAFDAHDGTRKSGGVTGHSVNTTVDDPNKVIGYVQSDDLGKLKAFADSADLKEAMQKAGVTSAPEMFFINRVEMKRY